MRPRKINFHRRFNGKYKEIKIKTKILIVFFKKRCIDMVSSNKVYDTIFGLGI
jgi:hypothetical protein